MSTIANAKVEHNYNRYNGYFFGCLHKNCTKKCAILLYQLKYRI